MTKDLLDGLISINPYTFVFNDSQDYIDAFGLCGGEPSPSGGSSAGSGTTSESTTKSPLVTPQSAKDATKKGVKDVVEKAIPKALKDVANKTVGRGIPPISPVGGLSTAVGKGAVSAGVSALKAGPGLIQNAAMALPNNRVKDADPNSDEFDKLLKEREKMAEKCNAVSKNLNP